jgi:hypothetical protein
MHYSEVPELSAFSTRSPSSSPVPISSLLLLCCTPPPLPGHVHHPAALHLPSTRRPTPFPTARATPAVFSSPCHVGPPEPSNRHETEGVTGAARRLEPNPVVGSPLPPFLEAMYCYKANPNPFPRPTSPFLPPCATEVRRAFFAGIRRNPFT